MHFRSGQCKADAFETEPQHFGATYRVWRAIDVFLMVSLSFGPETNGERARDGPFGREVMFCCVVVLHYIKTRLKNIKAFTFSCCYPGNMQQAGKSVSVSWNLGRLICWYGKGETHWISGSMAQHATGWERGFGKTVMQILRIMVKRQWVAYCRWLKDISD